MESHPYRNARDVDMNVRYFSVRRPDHPLATAHGTVKVHRLVAYEKIGSGPHKCHWCGCDVEWKYCSHTCSSKANYSEGKTLRNKVYRSKRWINSTETTVEIVPGHRTRAVEKCCGWCGQKFLCSISEHHKGNGKFCSIGCRVAINRARLVIAA